MVGPKAARGRLCGPARYCAPTAWTNSLRIAMLISLLVEMLAD